MSNEYDFHPLDPVPEESFLVEHRGEVFDLLFHRNEEKRCVQFSSIVEACGFQLCKVG